MTAGRVVYAAASTIVLIGALMFSDQPLMRGLGLVAIAGVAVAAVWTVSVEVLRARARRRHPAYLRRSDG